jgi:hypothetical protein
MKQLSLLDFSLEQAILSHYSSILFTDDLASFLNSNGFQGLTGEGISNFILFNFKG